MNYITRLEHIFGIEYNLLIEVLPDVLSDAIRIQASPAELTIPIGAVLFLRLPDVTILGRTAR